MDRLVVRPHRLPANSDRGYQVSAIRRGDTIQIEARCVVASNSSHVAPRYPGYLVAPRVYDGEHWPSLAEQIARSLGWLPTMPASQREGAARAYLRAHVDELLARYGAHL